MLNDRHFSSIPRVPKGAIRTPHGNAYRVYCVCCGKPAGVVLEGTGSFVWQCDECFQTKGPLPLPMLDEAEERLLREAAARIRTVGVG